MIHSRNPIKNINFPLLTSGFFIISLLIATYFIWEANNFLPQRKVVELFLSNLSKNNKAEAQKYWCFPGNSFNQVSNWKLASQNKSKSLTLNNDIDIEEIAKDFSNLQGNLSRLARFENFRLVYHVNASTKSGSNLLSKQWEFDVWEREKLLRYRKLAESILSEMYAEVENPGNEGEDLAQSINAAKYASIFATELAKHPVFGNLDNLAASPYCIMSAKEVKENPNDSND